MEGPQCGSDALMRKETESNSNREGLKDRMPGVYKSTHEIKKINDSGGNVDPLLHTLAHHFPTELPRFFQEVQKQETEDFVTIRITYIFEGPGVA